MNCLLDTCTFLWLTDRVDELSAAARAVLEDPGNNLFLSQVSSLEIQLKFNKGKLPLDLPPAKFIPDALGRHGIGTLPLEDAHIWTTERLPAIHHDPFDRLLVAQAVHEGMALVTPDLRIVRYPVRTLW